MCRIFGKNRGKTNLRTLKGAGGGGGGGWQQLLCGPRKRVVATKMKPAIGAIELPFKALYED